MVETQTLIIFGILLAGFIGAIFYMLNTQIRSLKEEVTNKSDDKVLMEWIKDMRSSVETQLKDQRISMDKRTKVIGDRLDNAAKVIGGVQKNLGSLEEFGKDMKDLSNILKSPKLRGNLGERFLYEILENFLPKKLYEKQYQFRDGTTCDAVIFTDNGTIPVDSKFPMENFQAMLKAETEDKMEDYRKAFINDVRKRIREISSKYILPEEGTTDQAIMYIPSESVYYEAVVRSTEVEKYAQERNVLITSPNTFTSFVNVVMVAYQQSELAEHAQEILKALSGIQREAEKFEEELDVLDGHVDRTNKAMDRIRSMFNTLFRKISDIEALGSAKDKNVSALPSSNESD